MLRRFSGRRWVSVDMYRHGSRDMGFAADRDIASGETEARCGASGDVPRQFNTDRLVSDFIYGKVWHGV